MSSSNDNGVPGQQHTTSISDLIETIIELKPLAEKAKYEFKRLQNQEYDGVASVDKDRKIQEQEEKIRRRDIKIVNMMKVQEDNEKQIQKLRQELQASITTNTDLEKDLKTYQSRFQSQDYKIREINKKCLEAEHQATVHKNETEQLKKQLSDKDRENKDQLRKISIQANSFEDRENRDRKVQKCLKEIDDLKKKLLEKESELEEQNNRIIEAEHHEIAHRQEIEQLQLELKGKERDNTELHRKFSSKANSIEDKENRDRRMQKCLKEIDELKKQLQLKESELEEKNTRLSRFMGNQLSNNNPNITDLSDKNRPTKLGERYQELYDNQWTDAFEIVTKYCSTERECVETLMEILKDAKDFCDKEVKKQEDLLKQALLPNGKHNTIPDHIYKQLKDLKKEMAVANVPEIYENFLATINKSSKEGRVTLLLGDYVKECIELCWLMSLQDPPVVFGTTYSSMMEFDTNVFRSYTQSGKYVDFIVWPPIYLYEGGPILSKGVAQGYRSRSVPANKREHKVFDDKKSIERPTPERGITSQETTQFSKSARNRNETYRSDHQSERSITYGRSNASPTDEYHQTIVSPKTMYCTKTTSVDAYHYEVLPTSIEWNNFFYYVKHYGEAGAKSRMGNRFDVCSREYQRIYGISYGYSYA